MKIYRLPMLCDSTASKEYCLGLDALNTHAVYMLYCSLSPGETNRKVAPGIGHEEIIYVTKGEIVVKKGSEDFTVGEGEAFHMNENDSFTLENKSAKESVYIAAGGHCSDGHHSHDDNEEETHTHDDPNPNPNNDNETPE